MTLWACLARLAFAEGCAAISEDISIRKFMRLVYITTIQFIAHNDLSGIEHWIASAADSRRSLWRAAAGRGWHRRSARLDQPNRLTTERLRSRPFVTGK